MRNASDSLMKLTNDNLANKTAVNREYWIFNRCGFTISRVCLREIWTKREKRENQTSRTLSKGEGGEVAGQRVGRTDYVDGTMPQMPGEKNDEKVPERWNSSVHFANLLAASTSRFVLSTWTNDNRRNASLLFKRHVFKLEIFMAAALSI